MDGVVLEGLGAWAQKRARYEKVITAIENDDGSVIAKASDEDLLGAAAICPGETGADHLALACLTKDAPKALAALLARPAWMAVQCKDKEEWLDMPSKMGGKAIQMQAAQCLGWILGKHPVLAWSLASLCLGRRELLGKSRVVAKPWEEGFKLAAALVEGKVLVTKDAHFAASVVEVAFRAGFVSGAEIAARKLMGTQEGHLLVEAALLRSACRGGVAGAKAWELYIEMRPEGAIEPVGTSELGLPIGSVGMKNPGVFSEREQPFAVFPAEIDPAWVAAANSRTTQDARIAGEMAARRSGSGAEGRPMLYPSVASLSHPLEPVWEVWSHSTKAGFALPKPALDNAMKKMRGRLNHWALRAGESTVADWRKMGEVMLASLYAKEVPSSFHGCEQVPKIEDMLGKVGLHLSPCAYAMHKNEHSNLTPDFGEDALVAIACASEAIGVPLASFETQARVVLGLQVEEAFLSKAQRGILMAETPSGFRARAPLMM